MYGISQAIADAIRHNLSATEERRLHAAYMAGDQSAGQRLVTSFLPVLYRSACHHEMPGGRYDLLGVAVEAFLTNLHRYDPAKGHRMWTYMRIAVRHAIHTHALANATFFKVSHGDRGLVLDLPVEKKRIGAIGRRLTGREARRMADMLGVSERMIELFDENMSNMRPEQLRGDTKLQGHGVDDPERVGSHLDFEARHDRSRLIEMLKTAVACLDARQRDILIRRFKEVPDTLQNLSDDYGVSRERIRQIETYSLAMLRHAMEHPDEMRMEGRAGRKQSPQAASQSVGLDGRLYPPMARRHEVRETVGRSKETRRRPRHVRHKRLVDVKRVHAN